MKLAFLLSSLLFATSLWAGDENNSSISKERTKLTTVSNSISQAVVHIHRGNGFVPVQLDVQALVLTRPSTQAVYPFLYTLSDQTTGYISWVFDYTPPANIQEDFWRDYWLVPNLGIVRVFTFNRRLDVRVSKQKTDNLGRTRTEILSNLELAFNGGKPCLDYEELAANVSQSIGDDFFSLPGHAEVPPPAKILSVAYTNAIWEIEIESPLTHERASFELDAAFKILKAMRADKQGKMK